MLQSSRRTFVLTLFAAVFLCVFFTARAYASLLPGLGHPPMSWVSPDEVVPDDGKDAAPALQAVLDSQKSDVFIVLNPGVYDIGQTLAVPSHVRLGNMTKPGVVFRFTGTTPSPVIQIHDATDVSLYRLEIDAAENPNATQGIEVARSDDVLIKLVTLKNFTAKGGFGPHAVLFSEKVVHSHVSSCTIENISPNNPWAAGIRIAKGSTNNSVFGTTIKNTGRGGILCNESPELEISTNTVSGSHGEGLGIELWGGCPRSIVEYNTVDHWISVDKSPQTAVRYNRISDPTGAVKAIGLELVDSSDCIFTDNTVDGGQQIGISISNTGPKEHIFWARNTIRNCLSWNAQIQGETGGATNHVFLRNTFEGALLNDAHAAYPNQGYGVRFNGNCRNILFLENTLARNGHGAVQTCGENLERLSFVRNILTDNGGPALTGSPGDLPFWSRNQTVGNQDNSIPEQTTAPWTFDLSVTAFQPLGHGLPVTLRCAPLDENHRLSHVLWDLGAGIAQTGTETVVTPQAMHYPPPLFVTVIAWDQNGMVALASKEFEITCSLIAI